MADGNRVLACVDRSHFADFVTDYAAWAAKRLLAPMELLHIIDRHPETATIQDRSGAIGIDAQESLLTELTTADANRSASMREQGRVFLQRLRHRAEAAGIDSPDIRQRHGSLIESLIEQQDTVHLFVLGRRGASAEHTRRDLGRNVEQVVRSLRKPILAVTEGFREPQRAMIAFDGGAVTRRGVEMVASSPLFRGMPIHLLMSGKARQEAHGQLAWAQNFLVQAGFDATSTMIPGDAESVIARAVTDLGIDILVMGAYGHAPWRSLLLGSKTSDLLRSASIPTLLIR
jgi:nucleotide-binding universal stress UspA family protein